MEFDPEGIFGKKLLVRIQKIDINQIKLKKDNPSHRIIYTAAAAVVVN